MVRVSLPDGPKAPVHGVVDMFRLIQRAEDSTGKNIFTLVAVQPCPCHLRGRGGVEAREIFVLR